MMIEKIGEIEK